jgi:hypothetical protein
MAKVLEYILTIFVIIVVAAFLVGGIAAVGQAVLTPPTTSVISTPNPSYIYVEGSENKKWIVKAYDAETGVTCYEYFESISCILTGK